MPPKLRKDKSIQGLKPTTSSTNRFGALSDDQSKQKPAKTLNPTNNDPPSVSLHTPTMLDKQPEDHSNTNQTKLKSNIPTMTTSPHSTPETQLATMQKDLATMVQVINLLSTSISKMDELDKIDAIESRQRSSETMLNNMVTNFRSEIDELKTTSTFNNTTNYTASYVDILKKPEKTNKNKTPPSGTTTTPLEIIEAYKPKHQTPNKKHKTIC